VLTQLEIHNFKSLQNLKLELGDLTILIGMNSAGKTSVLQSLALLKQSVMAGEITFNGNLVRVGSFKDLVYMHQYEQEIRICPTFKFGDTEVTYDFRIWQDRIREDFFFNGQLCWVWDSKSPGVAEPYNRVFLNQAAKGFGGGMYAPNISPDTMGEVQAAQRQLLGWFENLVPLGVVRGFTKYGYPLLSGSPNIQDISKRSNELQLLEEWLSSLILYRVNETRRDPTLRPQLDKVSERLGTLGVDISPYILGGPSVVIDLIEGDLWVSAVNAGYGINQIVPAITLGTLSSKGSLITIEEPEIHLHPKTQRLVGKILYDIVKEGKQLILTTHSPFLVDTIQQSYLQNNSMNIRLYQTTKEEGKAVYKLYDITDRQVIADNGLLTG
jgi:predicted ATPase